LAGGERAIVNFIEAMDLGEPDISVEDPGKQKEKRF